MSKNRLTFLKDAFPEFELQFSENDTKAVIVNPNYDENIIVYDDEYEFTVCFSFQHSHLDDADEIVDWIRKIISGNRYAIEFISNERLCWGSQIDAEELQDLSYEKLEQFIGYYVSKELPIVANTFKIRGWDNKNNLDYTITYKANGSIAID